MRYGGALQEVEGKDKDNDKGKGKGKEKKQGKSKANPKPDPPKRAPKPAAVPAVPAVPVPAVPLESPSADMTVNTTQTEKETIRDPNKPYTAEGQVIVGTWQDKDEVQWPNGWKTNADVNAGEEIADEVLFGAVLCFVLLAFTLKVVDVS
jgi:hypothetical protein